MSGMLERIENEYVEGLATVLLHSSFSKFSEMTEYRRGWLDGYSRGYVQLTGKTWHQLVVAANKMIEGSGHELIV
jgi:aspartate/methionine/tyrosine aminotransferase